ncbi:MAG: hypothetical protein HDR01_06830 [Lachnospiraceae bacterium]|nr:hypothetical protein [Lachnospiraceae bacterium]
MKETLYTIPLMDAFHADDECPFCYIERNVEQDLLDFVLGSGSSYMESDVREQTDKAGFCRAHFKKMFDYGNTLGNGWILKTHYIEMNKELKKQIKMFAPSKASLFGRKKSGDEGNSISAWVKERDKSCYICKRFQDTYERYLDTFFFMYKKDDELKNILKQSKGLCLHHFGDIMAMSDNQLSDKQKEEFYPILFDVMESSMERIGEDVAWLVEKFDYRNKDADWKNSKDAVQRGMQKLRGGYPADPVYKMGK